MVTVENTYWPSFDRITHMLITVPAESFKLILSTFSSILSYYNANFVNLKASSYFSALEIRKDSTYYYSTHPILL